MHRLASVFAVLVLLGLPLPATGEPPAPMTASLAGSRIVIDISNATVEIEAADGVEPSLTALPLVDGLVPADVVAVSSTAGAIRVTRRDQPMSKARDLALRLTLDRSQALAVRGHDLDVELTVDRPMEEPETELADLPDSYVDPDESGDGGAESPATAGQDQPSAATMMELVAADVVMSGVDGAAITMEEGSLSADFCLGRIELTSTGGMVDIRRHEGSLSLTGHEAEFNVSDGHAQIELDLDGGAFYGRSSRGAVSGRVENAMAQMEDWHGASSISGSSSTLEIRRSDGVRAIATGDDLDVTVDGWRGALTARLVGGSMRGGDWTGKAEVTGRDGTAVDLSGLRGGLFLNLSHGATATLSDVSGQLAANVNDGSLDAEDVRIVNLVAGQSRINLSGATKVEKMVVSDSELEADLTRLEGKATVTLDGSSRGHFQLRQPCLVWTIGRGGELGAAVSVSGCDQRLDSQRRRRHARSVQGGRPVELKLSLDHNAEADVVGYP